MNISQYSCKFGPYDNGQYVKEIVTSNVALNCDFNCECKALNNNTCLFGPDLENNFLVSSQVSSRVVDTCDQEWCTCDTHADVVRNIESGFTFEELIAWKVGHSKYYWSHPDVQGPSYDLDE